jgi:flagellar hook-length control protein FliK
LLQNPQIAAAQAAQAALLAANAAAGLNGKGAAAKADPLALGSNALPATGPLPGAAAVTDASRPTALPGGANGKPAANAATAAAPAPGIAADAAQPAPDSLTQALQHASARSKAGKEQALAAADSSSAGGSAASATQGAELKDSKLLQALEQGRTAQFAKNAEPVLAPLLARTEKPASERLAQSLKSSEPAYAGSTLGVSAQDYSASAAQAPAPAPAPEMQVAEQVTYWVSQNVQNAELKLDGLGQDPVQVSISMQGNEAQITFRSDEAATRDVLENAANHLKDMLQREGVVLSGVSVGTSGSGDAGGNERRARQAARQGLIAPLQVVTVTAAQGHTRAPAGRSVDLFV